MNRPVKLYWQSFSYYHFPPQCWWFLFCCADGCSADLNAKFISLLFFSFSFPVIQIVWTIFKLTVHNPGLSKVAFQLQLLVLAVRVCASSQLLREQRAALSLLSWRQTLMLVLGIILFSRSESERATICSNVRKCRHNHHGGGTWRAWCARPRGNWTSAITLRSRS